MMGDIWGALSRQIIDAGAKAFEDGFRKGLELGREQGRRQAEEQAKLTQILLESCEAHKARSDAK